MVMQREENSSTLTTDGVMYSYPLTNLNPGSFQLTVTPVSVVGDNTVKGPESARKKFTVGEWPSLCISVVTMRVWTFKHGRKQIAISNDKACSQNYCIL